MRNAEYFGEFKIASYDLAHSNLNRWRSWGLFSEIEIARMKEVEFTSSLLITLADGLFERTQSNIDKYYKKYDDEFQRQEEVVGEFRRTMEAIEGAFGENLPTSVYSNSSMFLQLFHLVRRLDVEGISLNRGRARAIISLGERIRSRENLPEQVALALASRFNRLSNQVSVSNFLFEHAAV